MVSILQRELRIVSRRKRTIIIRVLTTLLGFVISLFLLLAGAPGAGGQFVFKTLLFLSFWFCLIQGVRLAAGTISDEKREGTLGLLFLTDLRSIDIIFGKFFSVALPLVQPLLAFLPVLAISLLWGGVTGGEVFRAALVLATVILVSIAVGLFISAAVRENAQTGRTTMLLLLAAVALPKLAFGPVAFLRLLSPLTAYQGVFDPGYRADPDAFSDSLCLINAISLSTILGASFFLPRRWQDKPIVSALQHRVFRRRFSQAQRAAILDRNPGEWVAIRNSLGRCETLVFNTIMLLFGMASVVIASDYFPIPQFFHVVPITIAGFLLQLWLASAASYPMIEARRSGAIEIILSTPLAPNRLVTGQCAALMRQFIPPMAILMLASFGATFYQTASAGQWQTIPIFALFAFGLIATSVCVAAVGIWMGLREKTANAAFFKTLLLGVFAPPLLSLGCLPFPTAHLLVPIIAATQITGGELRRLLRNEKRNVPWRVGSETVPTPVGPPPIIKPPVMPRG